MKAGARKIGDRSRRLVDRARARSRTQQNARHTSAFTPLLHISDTRVLAMQVFPDLHECRVDWSWKEVDIFSR